MGQDTTSIGAILEIFWDVYDRQASGPASGRLGATVSPGRDRPPEQAQRRLACSGAAGVVWSSERPCHQIRAGAPAATQISSSCLNSTSV